MKQFRVFFEMYGRKVQCIIECESKTDVFNYIASKINIHKVEELDKGNDTLDSLKDLFGFK